MSADDRFRWMVQARAVDASFNARHRLLLGERPSFFAQMVDVAPPDDAECESEGA